MNKVLSTEASRTVSSAAASTGLKSSPTDRTSTLDFGKRLLLCMLAALVGCLIEIASFYPGYINSDSLDQLLQARRGIYLLYHPPIMAWIWRPLDALFPGPIGMLVLQNAFLWSGLAIIVALASKRKVAALLVLAIGLSPAVVAQLSTVWKDSQLGAALVLAWALLLTGRQRSSLVAVLASVPPLIYASAVRSNGPTAAFPIAVFLGMTLHQEFYRRSRRGKWVAGAVAGVLVVEAGVFSNDVLGVRGTVQPLQGPFLHDLVGMSFDTGNNELPGYLQSGPHASDLGSLREIYKPDNLDPLFWTKGRSLWVTSDPRDVKELYHRWLTAVSRHPILYLRHRWELFSGLLGLGVENVIYPFQWQVEPNSLGIVKTRGILNKWAMSYLELTKNTVFFRAWAYLLLTFLTGIASFRYLRFGYLRSQDSVLCLAFSVYLYAFAYFFVTPTGAFRYIWWSVVGSLLMPLTLWSELRSSATAFAGLGRATALQRSATV